MKQNMHLSTETRMNMQTNQEMVYHGVSPLLAMTTSFQRRSIHHKKRSNNSYSRTHNPNFEIVKGQLNQLYGSNRCVLYSSGIAACSSLFWTLLEPGCIFLLSSQLYEDTMQIIEELQTKIDFEVILYKVHDQNHLHTLIEQHADRIKLIYLESCSNPCGYMINLKQLRKQVDTYCPNNQQAIQCAIAVDNSWLSGYLFNPLDHGVDLVLESSSKYVGGGKIIGGYILGRHHNKQYKNLTYKIQRAASTFGQSSSPFNCWLLSESLETLSLRMDRISRVSLLVAQFLSNNTKVTRVFYPLLESHHSFKIAQKYLTKGGPGVIWFHVPIDKDRAIEMADEGTNFILFATSYGKSSTMIDPYPEVGTNTLYDPNSEYGIEGTWMRLAIGHANEANDIVIELEGLFENYI
eukprot:TRINITY_DN11742_c0_g1_i1.p1 TRINITY_DN11742_c0_g1~~TRINITY_DN11742_c0_g1_i1.p1  ORF type:complete len:407 (+),score=42.52 TRINITY_DN11742_c0_g1_i1:166-1386(+)